MMANEDVKKADLDCGAFLAHRSSSNWWMGNDVRVHISFRRFAYAVEGFILAMPMLCTRQNNFHCIDLGFTTRSVNRLNRDRAMFHGVAPPHRRAYGSVPQRFDEHSPYLASRTGSPILPRYLAGSASGSPEFFDNLHGPCGDLLVPGFSHCHTAFAQFPITGSSPLFPLIAA